MINFDYFGLKGDKGIETIQTTGKQIGDELIVDLNQILDMDAQYHSVFVHVGDDKRMEFGTSGAISGHGTVSVVYVDAKQETDFLFVNLAGKLIPRDIRTGEGFYSVAKTLALKSDSVISLAILPDPEKTLLMFKVSYEHKDAIDDISLINPLEYLNVKELKRSSYFKDSFTPLNSVLQVIILPDTTSKIDAVKIHAITEDVIEACHNDIVAWEKNSKVQPILIRGHDDHIKTIERWNILKEFFNERGIQCFETKSVEGNILSKIVNLIYLLDYSSIYRAILNQIDPSPVNAIDFVKERL